MAVDGVVFDQEFLKKLEYLHIVAKKVFMGRFRAERRSKKIGTGLEFADHRDYSPGDDFRYLDWNVFGRMEKMLLRLYEEEEDLYVYILLDRSSSMSAAASPKLAYAMKIAAALSYVALANMDRVGIISFADNLSDRLPVTRGKGQIFKVFRFLEQVRPGGVTRIEPSFRSFVHQYKRRGIVVVLSDFYDPTGFAEGINFLRYNRFEPFIVQVTDEDELNPALSGDLRLVDCESGETREITVTKSVLKRYREAHAALLRELEEFCVERQLSYFRSDVKVPFDELILRIFRAGGFLR